MFRDYRCFLPTLYKWLVWLAYPVVALVCCYMMQTGVCGLLPEFQFGFLIPALALGSGFVMVEVVQDYFILAGSLGKNQSHLEFIKCSERGKQVYRNILVSDMIRRFLTILIVQVGNACIAVALDTPMSKEIVWAVLYFIFWDDLMCLLTIVCARFISFFWYSLSVAYVVSFLNLLNGFFIDMAVQGMVLLYVALAAVSVAIAVATVWIALKKMEGSFYDK